MNSAGFRKAWWIAAVVGLARNEPAVAQWSHKEGAPWPAPPGILVQPFTTAEWEASNFAASEDLQWFRDAKLGILLQFGLSTHDNLETSWGACYTRKAPDAGHGPIADATWQSWAKEFRFERFKAQEWVELAQRAGGKYFVAQAKHHEGFHWWDTAYSEFKVTRTPFGRDLLKEQADACHAAGMPFGIYYAQREWYHPDYQPVDTNKVERDGLWWKLKPGETSPVGPRHCRYLEYNRNAVRELLTRYGKVDLFWWDAAWWGGMFTAEMWDAENLTRFVRQLQPQILQNNRCSVPGDFDTPEQRLGSYQDWRPWETVTPLAEEWGNPLSPVKPLSQLVSMLVHTASCDGNLLLGLGPQWNGAFTEPQRKRLFELGDWLKQNGRAIYGTHGGPWKFAEWGGSTRRGSTAYLHIVRWTGDTLRLPALPGREVKSARMLTGAQVSFAQSAQAIEITVPKARQDGLDTIVELTLDASADGSAALEAGTVLSFDAATYGDVVSRQAQVTTSSRHAADAGAPQVLVAESSVADFAFHTQAEANPWVKIDLGRECAVTGVRVLNRVDAGQAGQDRAASLRLSVSHDGRQWQEVWRAQSGEPAWEIPVTDFRAGVQVPGRSARFVRLDLCPAKPEYLHLRHVEVWGKASAPSGP